MGKKFELENEYVYEYGVKTDQKRVIERVSRWIEVKPIEITKNHSLWDYTTDYDDIEELPGKRDILVFRYKGRLYCLQQFLRLSYPYFFIDNDSDKTRTCVSGYDSTNYYNPLLIEINDCGECIRLYREVIKYW